MEKYWIEAASVHTVSRPGNQAPAETRSLASALSLVQTNRQRICALHKQILCFRVSQLRLQAREQASCTAEERLPFVVTRGTGSRRTVKITWWSKLPGGLRSGLEAGMEQFASGLGLSLVDESLVERSL